MLLPHELSFALDPLATGATCILFLLCGSGSAAAPSLDKYPFLKKPESTEVAASEPELKAQATVDTRGKQQQEQQQEQQEQQAAESITPLHGRMLAPEGEPPLFEKKWPTMRGALWVGTLSTKVPDTFVATSHEYSRIFDYGTSQLWGDDMIA